MKLKRTITYNSNVNFDCHYSDPYTSGTIHMKQQTGEFNRAKAAVNLLKIKFPQYDFGPDPTDFEEDETGKPIQKNTYSTKMLYGGDYYENVTFENLKTDYDKVSEDFINDTLLQAGGLYEFCGPELANKIIDDGNAKKVLETFTRAVKEKEETINNLPIESDITKAYLANKAIADFLGMPDLFADVEEVTVKDSDGKETSAVLVHDEDEQEWSPVYNFNKLGNTLEGKKAILDMHVFAFLTGQQTFYSNDFKYKYKKDEPNKGEIEGYKMTSLGNFSIYYEFDEEDAGFFIPFFTQNMSEKIKNADIKKYREVLKNTGLDETLLENAVHTMESLKALIKKSPTVSDVKDLIEPTINAPTTSILKDNALNSMGLRRYSFRGFMKEVRGLSFENKGIENSVIFNKQDVPAQTTYSVDMDKETKELAEKIKTHKRSFLFFKFDNSDSYNSIINALNEYEETGNKNLVIEFCDTYEKTHINPRTNDGKERLKNIIELKNKFEILREDEKIINAEQTLNNPNATNNAKEEAKKEEIRATFEKLSLLSMKNDGINVGNLKIFYENPDTSTAPDILGMEYKPEEYKDAAARLLIHSMIKEEMDKPQPDFNKINEFVENPTGLIEVLKKSNTIDKLFDEKENFIGQEQFLKSTKEIMSFAKRNDKFISDQNTIIYEAINAEENINKEAKEKRNKEEEEKQIKESINLKKLEEEYKRAADKAVEEADHIPEKYRDNEKIVEAYQKNKEIKIKEYKEKTGKDYQPKDEFLTKGK